MRTLHFATKCASDILPVYTSCWTLACLVQLTGLILEDENPNKNPIKDFIGDVRKKKLKRRRPTAFSYLSAFHSLISHSFTISQI